MAQIKDKYGFPLFTKNTSTNYLIKAEKTHVSDIWALWHYMINTEKKRYPGKTDQAFLLSVLEQSQYFYETANLAPIKSKPLLYYYAFLNITKAAIVFNDPSFLSTGLDFNHGIDPCTINSKKQLKDCYITIKSLVSNNGKLQKLSVAYLLTCLFEGISLKEISKVNHTSTYPYTIDIISLLMSCVGIHRTACETFKENESFIHIESPIVEKHSKTLTYSASIRCDAKMRRLLTDAGYSIKQQNSIYYFKVDHTMPKSNLTRQEFYVLSKEILSTGLWFYSTGDEYRLYISPNRLIMNSKGVYIFSLFDTRQPNIRFITLSPATIIYYLMFFFGSITRYHPYLFEKVLSDKQFWLVSEFLRTQPFQFIQLLTSKVLGKYIYTSKMPFIQK